MKKFFFTVVFSFTMFSLSSQNCQNNEVVLQLTTGTWASEISWSITDTLGNLIDSTSQSYINFTTYYDTICLINGCYNFNMFDSYGDGWQGGSYILFDSLGNIISSGNLQGSFFFGSDLFSINSSNCPVLGCTLPIAVNYNPNATIDDTSCFFLSDNVNLLFNWADTSLPINNFGGSYTDVYGLAINEGEYAVIGSTMGTHIIDVTNPAQSYEAAFIPGAQQYNVTHRDFFHMDHYLYGVCDQGNSTLQIIDISNLPNSVNLVYDSDSLISTSHNIFIDTINKKLYSTNGVVLDVSNPNNPSFLFNMGFTFHDCYIENDTGYFNCYYNGLQIYEMTNNTPQYINSLLSYPQQGTNHSGWKKDDIYILADENHGLSLKVIDLTDLNNLQVIALFNSGVDSNSIAHNVIIKDNFAYVSYYHDGLQIFDLSDPYNPIKAGYYDTYLLNNHNGFAGNWGVDPLLPSGNILASDIQSGLFVLDFNYNEESICQGDSLLFDTSYIKVDSLYISTIIDSLGYPDIMITELSTIPVTSSNQSFSICDSDSLVVGSNVYTSSGIYTDTLSSITSCDSIIYTSLLVNNSTFSFDTLSSSISIIWNGIQLSESGDYSVTLVNSSGCDSITNINFTFSDISTINNNNNKERTLIKKTDLLGRESKEKRGAVLLYLYDDGTVEKRIVIE